MKKSILYGTLILILLTACAQKDKKGNVIDTPTTGKLKILVDEGYKPIVDTSVDVFESIYHMADIQPFYVSEGDAVNGLLRDSAQVIIITRKLKEDEMAYFKSRGFTPPITPLAYDAVALILHPSNRDSVLTVAQVRDILTGNTAKWAQINPKSTLGDIQVVFDNPLSGTVRFAKDSIIGGAALTAKASALQSNEEVINYVSKNKNAIGLIGSNWISDTDDKGVQTFLKNIRIADIALETGKEGYGPYQAYLAQGWYPFKRTVYFINAQARKGLGLGFASFLAGDTGQRIVLKDGLLPAQAPTRIMQFTR